jgi:hypothetical protein
MKHIAIVGAGQSGLLLAIGLLQHGIHVSLYSQETPEEIINGRIRSSQAIFNSALEIERQHELNFWDKLAPNNNTLSFYLKNPASPTQDISWIGELNKPFQSVDQRLKIFSWLKEFTRLGGKLHIQEVNSPLLNQISNKHDLTIVASGKGALRTCFKIDQEKNTFKEPQRHLTLLYAKGMEPSPTQGVKINIIPGVGEYFTLPGLTYNGTCEMMLFEGLSDSEFTQLQAHSNPDDLITAAKQALKKYVPHEYERCHNICLTDDKAFLSGNITPTIRKPITQLDNGKYALGMGDCIVLNDPISGQGANAAIRCADIYLKSILNNQDCFDKDWMQTTFDKYWEFAQWPVMWSNMLLQEPKPYILNLLKQAQYSQKLANAIANGFDSIDQFAPALSNENNTIEFIEKNMKNNTQETFTIGNLIEANVAHLSEFLQSPLMQLIHSKSITNKNTRKRLLDYLQIFSDKFQIMVKQRFATTTHPHFKAIAKQHYDEEIDHNVILKANRHMKPTPTNQIIEHNADWFINIMKHADDITKHIVMHLILESTADMFFKEAYQAFLPYEKIEYLQLHDEADEEHAQMGMKQLESIDLFNIKNLIDIYDEAWGRLKIICDEIAKQAEAKNIITDKSQPLAA